MLRRDLFKILGGVLLAPFLPRSPVAPEVFQRAYENAAFGKGMRMYITNDPEYYFGFTGFKPADGPPVAGQIFNVRDLYGANRHPL